MGHRAHETLLGHEKKAVAYKKKARAYDKKATAHRAKAKRCNAWQDADARST
ncbi:hypothetical protein ACFU99_01850 [Streptomyces sp. NPDC057654]|uniref:hypothetical protein n=1 Tax=Streptomyces sp. NPDC057654 TaxID=3346196 RepID=UPI0036B1D50E